MGGTGTSARSVAELDLRSHADVEGRHGGNRYPDWRLQPISIGGIGGRIFSACSSYSQCGCRMCLAGGGTRMVGSTGQRTTATLSNRNLSIKVVREKFVSTQFNLGS